ncbi:MAG TPA: TerC family protein [Acidimicrobiales bacterium]|nr:TerC family protein [Acidimicrobiales bacterium]
MIPSYAILASESSSNDANFASFDVPVWVWFAFLAFVTALLIADLLIVHRRPHAPTTKEAAIESAVWISIGLAFTFVILGWHGGPAATEYISGYLIEKSLSVDNVFVWALIMSYFAVPREYQFRVLFWGIFGALVLRFIFIFVGVSLLQRFEWMLFVFGAFLLVTAVRMLRHDDEEVHPEHNPVLRLVRKVIPSTTEYNGQRLFVRSNAKLLATPLLAVLIVIETSDVVFAVDSIPAILAVSREQFIVFSSNAFAILGLRALYFLLADLREKFSLLQQGLAVILAFVGVKMIVSEWYHIPTAASLGVIALVLAVSIWLSIRKDTRQSALDAASGGGAAGDVAANGTASGGAPVGGGTSGTSGTSGTNGAAAGRNGAAAPAAPAAPAEVTTRRPEE